MWPCIVRRRAPRVLALISYLYHLDYGIAVTMSFLSIVFTTLHMVWLVEFYLHGILRMDKFKYLYQDILIPSDYFEKKFQYYSLHPIYMVVGFNLCQASGMLVFRVCCCYNRSVEVFVHGLMTSMAVPFAVMGWHIIQKFYLETEWFKPERTFHCWLGLITFIFTLFQIINGIIVFVILRIFYPYKTAVFRTRFTPYHNYIGNSTYLLSTATTISGMSHVLPITHPPTYIRKYLSSGMASDYSYENLVIALTHIKYTHLSFGISCVFVFYTLAKEDFRHRGRVLVARDNTDDDFYH